MRLRRSTTGQSENGSRGSVWSTLASRTCPPDTGRSWPRLVAAHIRAHERQYDWLAWTAVVLAIGGSGLWQGCGVVSGVVCSHLAGTANPLFQWW